MNNVSEKMWVDYLTRLRRVNDAASNKMLKFIEQHPPINNDEIANIIDFGYSISTQYGEAAAELACRMHDAVAKLSGLTIDPAIPAETATIKDVAKSIRGTLKRSQNIEELAASVGRLVKRTADDTVLNNAMRDGAQVAWIPHGDTCAYCIALAANGWRPMSREMLKDGHAEHIHANCDCTYGIKFPNAPNLSYAFYNPERYERMYDKAEGTGREKINAMRRRFYKQNKDEINAQKRSAYAKSKELNSSAAEETNVGV